MLTVLSPAKKLLVNPPPCSYHSTKPALIEKTKELAQIMKSKSVAEISSLMDLSDSLAELNFNRYQNYSFDDQTNKDSYPALFLFQGDVYQGLQAKTWDEQSVMYSQSHLAILSGLYGVLKPLDRIQPYRLEMGTHLSNSQGNTLYQYWHDSIAKLLNQQLDSHKNPILINLASSEYFRAIDLKQLKHPVVTVNFYETVKNAHKMIGIHAKKARGAMARYLMQNQIDNLDDLKQFKDLNYRFDKQSSTDNQLNFAR